MYYPSMGLFVLLKNKLTSDTLLIVNTHLLFNKNRGHVKLGMLVLLMKSISKIKSQYPVESVFFCGDFNMAPCSMLYNFMINKGVNLSVDLK